MENIDIVNSKGEDMKCPTMLKTAGKKKKEPGYSGVQGAYNRAVRAGDKGIKKFRTHPVLKKKYRSTMIKNYIVQPAIGTAIGRILGGPGAGTALGFSGGILSGMIGQNIDRTKATRDWLQDRGMTHKSRQPRFAMTPEAKEKYLSKKYQGGGYGKGKTAMNYTSEYKKLPAFTLRRMKSLGEKSDKKNPTVENTKALKAINKELSGRVSSQVISDLKNPQLKHNIISAFKGQSKAERVESYTGK